MIQNLSPNPGTFFLSISSLSYWDGACKIDFTAYLDTKLDLIISWDV